MQSKLITPNEDFLIPSPSFTSYIKGHDTLLHTVKNTFDHGHMPHAWMFCGPKGIGKASCAYHLARHILSNGDTDAQQQSHPIFRQVANKQHPDLYVIEPTINDKTKLPQSQITVESVRNLSQFLSLSTTMSPYRVIIIDSIDIMNTNAANALLKAIEEPPKHTYFFLANHRPDLTLPTIASRCISIPAKRLSFQETEAVIQQTITIPPEYSKMLSCYSFGCPGKAFELFGIDAWQLLTHFIDILCSTPNPNMHLVHPVIDQLISAQSKYPWILANTLYLYYSCLARYTKYIHGILSENELLDIELPLLKQHYLAQQSSRLLTLVKQYGQYASNPNLAHLDKRTILVNLFEAL